jgi:beta-glucosidase
LSHSDADYALVFVENPKTGIGYNAGDLKNGGNGYFPISLQYGDYTAEDAREVSIAGGDPLEEFTNRSYKNKTVTASNISDLTMIKDTRAKMKGKPVIVSIAVDNPMIFNEFEELADAILISFRVQDQAVLDIMTGMQEPSGMLPIQMPASMVTVEKQAEDTPQDMNCHEDSEGNKYDFGFGLNWSGVIKDERSDIYSIGN